jgi:polysaccharide pyruvyl transferase WcaK-like protein
VALNVSGLLWHPNRHVSYERYRLLVHTLLRFWEDSSTPVRVIAHVHAPGTTDDDSSCATELAAQYVNATAVIPETLEVARSAIADCSMMVGARMHACLNALSLDVPTLPLAYSDKFRALFADLAYPSGIDLRDLPDGVVTAKEILSRVPSVDQTRAAHARGVTSAEKFVHSLVAQYG